MKRKKSILLLILLAINFFLKAQSSLISKLYIEPSYYYGSVLPQRDNIAYLLHDHIQAYQITVGVNTYGTQDWHKFLNYPRFGFGYYHSNLGNDNVYGQLNAFHGSIAIKTFKPVYRINLEHNITAGLGFVSKQFLLHNNSFDIAIGSPYNFFLQYSVTIPFRVTNSFELYAGASFAHISVANIIEPNYGLNMALLKLGGKYNLGKIEYVKEENGEYGFAKAKRHFVSLIFALGRKQFDRFGYDKYWVYAISPEYCYKITPVIGFGGGVDFYYDTFVRPYLSEYKNLQTKENIAFHSTAHATIQLFFGKLSFLLQPGMYVHKNFDMYNRSSYKFGFRYQIFDHFSLGVLLKAHWLAQADVLEFGLGYTL